MSFRAMIPGPIKVAARSVRNRMTHWVRMRRGLRSYSSAEWTSHGAYVQRTTIGTDADYVAMQRSKMDAMIDAGTAVMLDKDVAMFRRRFEIIKLPVPSTIVCLAARLGAEVKAWRDLGHPAAVGTDLHPGPDNPYVVAGDFHDLPFADGSLDAVYFNSFDHARDIDRVTLEVARTLRPGGIFIVDLIAGFHEGYIVGPRDITHWPSAKSFAAHVAAIGNFEVDGHIDLGRYGSPLWSQHLLRKPHNE